MRLIASGTIGVPDSALALYLSVWQSCKDYASAVSLLLLGQHDREPLLAVASRHRAHEEFVADLVADALGTEPLPALEEETLSSDMALAHYAAAWHLVPRRREARHVDTSFFGSRFDPLGRVYPRLQRLDPGVIAGVGIVLRPRLTAARSRLSVTSFGLAESAEGARAAAHRLADAYAAAGARPFVSAAPRRSIDDLLTARLRFWRSRVRLPEEVAALWHPPYDVQSPAAAHRRP
jgi:hypothetical protein